MIFKRERERKRETRDRDRERFKNCILIIMFKKLLSLKYYMYIR